MFPIKMLYDDFAMNIHETVDVYEIQIGVDETWVICWVPSKGYWITSPISFVKPLKEKKELKE